jgi:hypothetical protein
MLVLWCHKSSILGGKASGASSIGSRIDFRTSKTKHNYDRPQPKLAESDKRWVVTDHKGALQNIPIRLQESIKYSYHS